MVQQRYRGPLQPSVDWTMSATRTLITLHDSLQYAATSPYRFVFLRNTYDPIALALKARDTEDCRSQLESWFKLKLREAQYIQVAVGSSVLDMPM